MASEDKLVAQEGAGLLSERRQELENLARRLGYRFENLELLDQALRHSSYAHENPGSGVSNERLEFLGDAVLDLTVSTLLLAQYMSVPSSNMTYIKELPRNEKPLTACTLGDARSVEEMG